MMIDWDYGGAYKKYPIETGTAVFADGSRLKTHDIYNPLPSFMLDADTVFVDPPWNKGNLRSFYTKADKSAVPFFSYQEFYSVLFQRIEQINPNVCYVEVGKESLADFVYKMRSLYKHVTFYNSSYYHKAVNLCYIVRGSIKASRPRLDGKDEEDIIEWICANEKYSCIGDLCMGRGLVAVNAFKNGHKFVGTELNHKRLSVALKNLVDMGAEYKIEEEQ